MMNAVDSQSLRPEERPERLFGHQRYLVRQLNKSGRGALIKRPTLAELAEAKTARALEALVRSHTRPI
jgi:hypothetical protein